MTLHWYAKFFRKAAEATTLGDLEFGFDATTWDWSSCSRHIALCDRYSGLRPHLLGLSQLVVLVLPRVSTARLTSVR